MQALDSYAFQVVIGSLQIHLPKTHISHRVHMPNKSGLSARNNYLTDTEDMVLAGSKPIGQAIWREGLCWYDMFT